MSEVKHTPGPWEVMYEQRLPWGIEISPNIMTMRRYAYSSKSKNIDDVLNGVGFKGDEREEVITANAVQEANARLIAAAPELLKALKMVLPENNMRDGKIAYPGFEICEIARAAIAKAEGRS